MSTKVLTPIVDKNGKHTSVWRRTAKLSRTPETIASVRGSIPASRLNIIESPLLPRNPFVRVITLADGSKSMYVQADKVAGAIEYDANNDLSYRLPVDKLLDIHNISPHNRAEYEKMSARGDLVEQHYAFRDAMPYKSMTEIIAPLLSTPEDEAELRKSFFDRRGFGEQVVTNADGSVEGYLYHFRDAYDVSLEEIRPDLVVDDINDDLGGFKEFATTEKYLREFFSYEDGSEAAFREDYMDEVLDHISRYGHPKAGSSRITFFTEDSVIKFPLNGGGIVANANEYTQANIGELEYFEGVPVADNELRYTANGMPYLVMERVNTDIRDGRTLPEWADRIDDYQVGINSRGEYVAFDL